jgi:4-hydroxy-3-methylbut-2-enyl diphosphate reductase IspH
MLEQCHRAEHVGICGATSTPKWLMEEVKQFIVDSL